MTRAIVIATDLVREVFALENLDGDCAVFWVLTGPALQAADIVLGQIGSKGHCKFLHEDGVCWATGETGPIKRTEALRRVHVAY